MSNQELSEVGPNGGLTIPDYFTQEQIDDYRKGVDLAFEARDSFNKRAKIAREIAEAATNSSSSIKTRLGSVWAEGRDVGFDDAQREFLFQSEIVNTLIPPRQAFVSPKSNQPFAENVKKYGDSALVNMAVSRLMPERDVSDRTQRTYTIGAFALMEHLVNGEFGQMNAIDRQILGEFLVRVANNIERHETVGNQG